MSTTDTTPEQPVEPQGPHASESKGPRALSIEDFEAPLTHEERRAIAGRLGPLLIGAGILGLGTVYTMHWPERAVIGDSLKAIAAIIVPIPTLQFDFLSAIPVPTAICVNTITVCVGIWSTVHRIEGCIVDALVGSFLLALYTTTAARAASIAASVALSLAAVLLLVTVL